MAWIETPELEASGDVYVKRWNGFAWVGLGGSASSGGISASVYPTSDPVVVIGADGNPIVAWLDYFMGRMQIYLRRWNGTAWVELGGSASGKGVSQSSDEASSFSLTLEANGNPVMAWTERASNSAEIYVKHWNGTAWAELGNGSASNGGLSANAGYSSSPSIAAGSDGKVVVAWQDRNDDDYTIYLRQWTGAAWEELGGSATGRGIRSSASYIGNPSVTVGANGQPIVVWEHFLGDLSNIVAKRWDGIAWVPMGADWNEGGINNETSWASSASLAAGPGGLIVVTWHQLTRYLDSAEIYVKAWNGANWVEIDAGSASGGGISDNPSWSASPSLAVARNGSMVIAWDDEAINNHEIYVRRHTPVQFQQVYMAIVADD